MNAHIYKYQLPITDHVIEIELPEHHEYCDIQSQNESIHLWCMVNPHAPLVKKRFKIFATGQEIESPENYYFIKTVQIHNGALVFHVFEVME